MNRPLEVHGGALVEDQYVGPQLDITGGKAVGVQIRQDGKVLWVHVAGVCVLRICQIQGGVEVQDDSAVLKEEMLCKGT